ncbi:hypothetical protein GCM10010326_74630 [Streptomyces xanthochromogenes]|uniref:Uncharacterized protein n=1 Tax=Streptomyces xanthochromogenes TaxID=67384 RepID=A0ABQ3AWE0_9ACTN|nr:hypothetical protein GCM10010326_74630 [Streptomyces xanthochromogenes]
MRDSEAIAHRGWGRYHPKLNVPNLVVTIDVVASLTGQNLGQTPEEMLADTFRSSADSPRCATD